MCRLAPGSGSLASGLAPLPGDWAWQGRVPCLLEVGAGVSQDPASPDHLPSPPSFNSGGSGTSPWPGPGVTSTSHPGVTRVSPPASKPLTLASSCPPDPFLGNSASLAPQPPALPKSSRPSHLEDDDEGQPGGQDGPEVLGDVILVIRPWRLPVVFVPAESRRAFRRSWAPAPPQGSNQESLGRLQDSPQPRWLTQCGGLLPTPEGIPVPTWAGQACKGVPISPAGGPQQGALGLYCPGIPNSEGSAALVTKRTPTLETPVGHTQEVGPSRWKGMGSLNQSLNPAHPPPASTEFQATCCEIQCENSFFRLSPLCGGTIGKK